MGARRLKVSAVGISPVGANLINTVNLAKQLILLNYLYLNHHLPRV